MTDARRTPLDFDSLDKGSVVTREEIECIYNCKFGTTEYSIRAMKLAETIEKELEARNLYVTVKQENGALVILDDTTASRYNAGQAMLAFSRMARRHHKLQQVDVAKLTDEDRTRHARGIMVIGTMLLAARKAKREALKALPHIRNTPELVTIKDSTNA